MEGSTEVFFSFFLSWPHLVACGILVPRTEIEPTPAVESWSLNHWATGEAWSLNHWTTGEVPRSLFFYNLISVLSILPMQQTLISVNSRISSHTSQSCIEYLEDVQVTRGCGWEYKVESDLWSPFVHSGITAMANTRNVKDLLPLQLPQGPYPQYLSAGHTSQLFFC